MTFVRANPLGWSLFELLLSSQMNAIDSQIPFALDGRDGGTYNPTAPIIWRNAWTFDGDTLPVLGTQVIVDIIGSTGFSSASDAVAGLTVTGHANAGSGDAGTGLTVAGGVATGAGAHGIGAVISGGVSGNTAAGGRGLTVNGGLNNAGGGDGGLGIFVQGGILGSGVTGKFGGLAGEFQGGDGSFDGGGGGGLVVEGGDHGSTATGVGAIGIVVTGGNTNIDPGGIGIQARGGDASGGGLVGGRGVVGIGGASVTGGTGGHFTGGPGSGTNDGVGLEVFGVAGSLGAQITGGGANSEPALRVNGQTGDGDAIRANSIGNGFALQAAASGTGNSITSLATAGHALEATNTSGSVPAILATNSQVFNALGAAIHADTSGGGNTSLRVSAGAGAAHIYFATSGTPITLVNGMMWWDGTNLKFRRGGSTVTIA